MAYNNHRNHLRNYNLQEKKIPVTNIFATYNTDVWKLTLKRVGCT